MLPLLPTEVVARRPARRQLVEVVGAGVAVRQHLLQINHIMKTMVMMARNFTDAFSRNTRLALSSLAVCLVWSVLQSGADPQTPDFAMIF